MTKDAKEGSPVVTEQVDQIVQEILTLVDIKNAVFESQRKGKLSADEGKIKDAAEEEKKAWILAKVSQIRTMASKMNNEEGSGEAGNKDLIFNTLKELQQVCDFTSETKDVQIVRMNVELGKALKLPGWELKVFKMLKETDFYFLFSESESAVRDWSIKRNRTTQRACIFIPGVGVRCPISRLGGFGKFSSFSNVCLKVQLT